MAKKEKIHPLQVVKYLPGTNCKECGLMTCLAFGVALQAREKKIEDCPLLLTEKYRSFHDFLYEQFGKDLDVENTGLIIDRDRCLGCGDCVIVCNKANCREWE